jgi:hypothetical protein
MARKIVVKFRPRLNVWVAKQAGKVAFKGTEAECRAFEASAAAPVAFKMVKNVNGGTSLIQTSGPGVKAPKDAGLARLTHALMEDGRSAWMKGMGLTPLQFAAVHFIAQMGVDCCGQTTLEGMMSDNMTWFNAGDLVKGLGLTKAGANSLIGHLKDNGLVGDAGDSGGKDCPDQLYLSDKGLKAVDWEVLAALV